MLENTKGLRALADATQAAVQFCFREICITEREGSYSNGGDDCTWRNYPTSVVCWIGIITQNSRSNLWSSFCSKVTAAVADGITTLYPRNNAEPNHFIFNQKAPIPGSPHRVELACRIFQEGYSYSKDTIEKRQLFLEGLFNKTISTSAHWAEEQPKAEPSTFWDYLLVSPPALGILLGVLSFTAYLYCRNRCTRPANDTNQSETFSSRSESKAGHNSTYAPPQDVTPSAPDGEMHDGKIRPSPSS